MWDKHGQQWRDPAEIVSYPPPSGEARRALTRALVSGDWWDLLEELELTLLVGREYEHAVLSLSVSTGKPLVRCLCLAHPSGIAIDTHRGLVHVASTRNPNQVYTLAPLSAPSLALGGEQPLMPVATRFYPGRHYIHDLAVIGSDLYANSVGQNAIIRLDGRVDPQKVWWPRAIETDRGPAFDRNYLQLNSIAAGPTLDTSYFSASTDTISARRPGHRNFPVDGRGVIFSGSTREPVVRGLTRPHSARLHGGNLWVDNSGYGELGYARGGSFEPVTRLPGWTRGLYFRGTIAFVGTSRVIPRFRHYAPGLQVDRSVCGIHAVDTITGKVLGSIRWPYGNQVFAIEGMPCSWSTGFPFDLRGSSSSKRRRQLFYAYEVCEPGRCNE